MLAVSRLFWFLCSSFYCFWPAAALDLHQPGIHHAGLMIRVGDAHHSHPRSVHQSAVPVDNGSEAHSLEMMERWKDPPTYPLFLWHRNAIVHQLTCSPITI